MRNALLNIRCCVRDLLM